MCIRDRLYEAYQIYCAENNLSALKPRSFSEALIACQSRYNLEYCNNVTNAAGRRVRGFCLLYTSIYFKIAGRLSDGDRRKRFYIIWRRVPAPFYLSLIHI